jgi:hypothetical protein
MNLAHSLKNQKLVLKKRESNSLSPKSPNVRGERMSFKTALPFNNLDEI